MFASRISRAAFALAIFIFTTDCCYGRRRDSKSRDAEVEILSSLKGNVFGRTRELKAKLRQLRRRARFGGELDFTDGFYLQADRNITGGCRKVRLSRFIGNKERNCTSIRPLRYSVCGGFCLPKFRLTQLWFGHDYKRILEKARHRWRCVSDTYRYKKVRVICPDDGSVVRYRVKIVNSCVCKEFKRQHNAAQTPDDVLANQRRLKQSGISR